MRIALPGRLRQGGAVAEGRRAHQREGQRGLDPFGEIQKASADSDDVAQSWENVHEGSALAPNPQKHICKAGTLFR